MPEHCSEWGLIAVKFSRVNLRVIGDHEWVRRVDGECRTEIVGVMYVPLSGLIIWRVVAGRLDVCKDSWSKRYMLGCPMASFKTGYGLKPWIVVENGSRQQPGEITWKFMWSVGGSVCIDVRVTTMVGISSKRLKHLQSSIQELSGHHVDWVPKSVWCHEWKLLTASLIASVPVAQCT